MKVVLKEESKSYEYYNTYTVTIDKTNSADVRVCATVYKLTDVDLYDAEIRETEIEFYVNGVMTLYSGFEELYSKLYGKNAFDKLCKSVEHIAQEKFIQELKHPKIMQQLDDVTAKKYINKLIRVNEKYAISKTKMRDKDMEYEVWYSSNYIIKQLTKRIDKNLLVRHNCKPTTHKGDGTSTHEIAVLQTIINKKTIENSTINP